MLYPTTLAQAPPLTRRGMMQASLATADDHLGHYGHAMSWAIAGSRYDGQCKRCGGRVSIRWTGDGPRPVGDPQMVARADYLECASVTRRLTGGRRR